MTIQTEGQLVTLEPKPIRGPVFPTFATAKAWAAIRGLVSFMPRHRNWFIKGSLAALVTVSARLALPWPLRAIVDRWIEFGAPGAEATDRGGMIALVPASLDPGFAMGVVFLLIILTLGLFDFIERFCFAQFSIAVVRDLRAKSYRAAIRLRGSVDRSGDMVARLIGDTARVKTGLQGFLVHVATNGLVFLGVTIILFFIDIYLGAIFAVAGLATAAVAVLAANHMFLATLRHRKKEGQLAEQIRKVLRPKRAKRKFAKINKSSGRHEAGQTRIQGTATFAAHGIFGLAVLAALWVGVRGIETGRTSPGDIILFMMYALLMRAPVVQLARQGARTGKILGATYRVVQVLKNGKRKSKK